MAALVIALLLAAQAAPLPPAPPPPAESNEVDPVLIQPRGWLGGPVPTERNIIKALNEVARTQPDRVVCVPRQLIGSHRTQIQCATLRAWYDMNLDRDIPGKIDKMGENASSTGGLDGNRYSRSYVQMLGPPYELVNFITQRYRDPKVRARIQARKAAEAAGQPPVANPW